MLQPTVNESGPLYSLPCEVVVPAPIKNRIFGKGMAPGIEDDNRSFVRFNFDTDRIRVGLLSGNNLPACQRGDEWKCGILVDISKAGLQLLYHEELFPGEKFRVAVETVEGLSTVDACVARCRRLDSNCYSVGLERLAI